MRLGIQGVQEVQTANSEMIAALQPAGGLGRGIRAGTVAGHRYAAAITHVVSGTLRAAHRMEVTALRGRIYIDPTARNPRSGARAADYGPIEHARGGEHAFYERTVREQGDEIGRAGVQAILEELP